MAVPMPGDTQGIEVHVSNQGSAFTPTKATLKDFLIGAGETVAVDLNYGTDYWVRFVAVDRAGNRSDPSDAVKGTPEQVVNFDLGPNAVDSMQIRDAAIVTAKIKDLAVNDAKIANLSVGKLTAGKITAAVTVAGSFTSYKDEVNKPNDFMRLNANGLFALKNGVVKSYITSDGDAYMSGMYSTALTGARVVINPDLTEPDKVRFYPDNTNNYGTVESVSIGTGNNRQAGIVMYGNSLRNDQYTGYVAAQPNVAQLRWGSKDGLDVYSEFLSTIDGARVSASVIDLSVSTKTAAAGGNRISMTMRNPDGSYNNDTHLYYSQIFTSGGWRPWLAAANQGVAFKFFAGAIEVRSNTDSAFFPIRASGFEVGSSQEFKHDIVPYEPDSARRALGDLSPKLYYLNENPDNTQQLGFIAEEVHELLPQASNGTTLNIVGLVAAFRARQLEQDKELDTIRDELAELRGGQG